MYIEECPKLQEYSLSKELSRCHKKAGALLLNLVKNFNAMTFKPILPYLLDFLHKTVDCIRHESRCSRRGRAAEPRQVPLWRQR